MIGVSATSNTQKVSLQVLHNIALSLVASTFYMMVLVAYIKGTYKLTLIVQDELVLTFWGIIIYVIFSSLEMYNARSPYVHFKWLFR